MSAQNPVRDARRADCEAIAAIYSEGIAEGRCTFETDPRLAASLRDRAEQAGSAQGCGQTVRR